MVWPILTLLCAAQMLAAQSHGARQVTAVRHSIAGNTLRIAIELSAAFEFRPGRLQHPDRLYVDIPDCEPRIEGRGVYTRAIEGGLVSRVRVAEATPMVTRVVLDLREPIAATFATLSNPARLVIEVREEGHAPSPPATAPVVAQAHPPDGPAPTRDLPPALKLTGASAERGSEAMIAVSLTAPATQQLLAIEWKVLYPAPQLGIESGSLVASGGAKQAGKSLACAGRPMDSGTYAYTCILSGGRSRIPDGPLATMTFHVRESAHTGPATIRLVDTVAVTSSGQSVNIEPVQADVVIR